VTICWIGPPGLPAVRPDIATGLIYGYLDRTVPWEQALDRLKQVREFWQN
jgi:hypothetical protein